jgi:hypothetical protein
MKRIRNGAPVGKRRRDTSSISNACGRPVLSDWVVSTRRDMQPRSSERHILAGYHGESTQSIRLQLVNRIRLLIAKARYTIDADKIAERMLEDGF